MTKILFIHSSAELYGSDKSLLNIITHVNKEKFKIYVLLPCDGSLVQELKKIQQVNVDIFELAVLRRKNLSLIGGINYFVDFCKSMRFLFKYIEKNEIDIVDTNTSVVFPGAIAAKIMKRKSVWHIREIVKSQFENRVISFMVNSFSDCVIANSKSTAKALKVSEKKIRVIYNSIGEISCEKKSNSQIVVGMAGRINGRKGQKLFVDAASEIHKKYPDVIFKIAGDAYTGEEYIRKELEEYIREKKLEQIVILCGQVNNMKEFYSGIDIFVVPSIQPESFGLVVIEAMDCKIPVVATNHGGPTEIIEHGKDGFLVGYNSPEEMVKYILILIENPKLRQEIGEKGKEKKRTLFSVETMITKIENVFYEVVGE